MHPWPTGTASSPYPHRSWTDHHVQPSTGPKNPPYAHGPRSASFSASRPSHPNWNDLPPPPVPPRPAVLFPGFSSPALTHSDRDLFFVQPPAPQVKPSQEWSHVPLAAESSQRSGYLLNNTVSSPPPRWPPERSSSKDGAPVVPPRPMHLNDHAYAAQSESNGRPYSYAHHFHQASTPPPVVPPRPMTAYDDIRLQGSASAPVVPPKPLALATIPNSAPPLNPTQWLPQEAVSPTEQRLPPIPYSDSDASEAAEDSLLVPNPHPENSKRTQGHSRTHSADDVARAMELSLAESQSRLSGGRNLQEEEDHELQRVLADSLAMSRLRSRPSLDNIAPHKVGESSSSRLTPSLEPASTVEDVSPVSATADREAETETKRLQRERDSKAAIRKLMEQEERRIAQEKRELEQRDEELARQQAEEEEKAQKMEREVQERRDVELARRLASADEAGPSRPPNPMSASSPVHIIKANPVPNSVSLPASKSAPPSETNLRLALRPPQYDDIITTAPIISLKQHVRPRLSNTPIQSTSPSNASASNNVRGRTASAIATPQGRGQFSRASSVGAGAVSPGGQGYTSNASSNKESRQDPPPDQNNVPGPSKEPEAASTPVNRPGLRPGLPLHEPASTNNNNRSSNASTIQASRGESAELELLKGVSYGFEPPKTPSTPVELPDCSPFPEVISLYPAPAPSFHIMALSWRHLMRLLAQFETRIEPSVKTIAQSKNESVLRVAIQFLKLPYTTNEWRTVIHLSIDQPIPPNTTQAFRFSNGDTTVLPYSFALGETPPHLKISAISHLYSVPLSQTTPFPILPLALPNLALYLQSAMRDSRSRKVQHDTSNTMRRLARIVSTCYPEEVPTAEAEERESGRGVGGLFKRVIGRGGAQRRDTQGNEDVYDMVTPFRIDKYTTVSGT